MSKDQLIHWYADGIQNLTQIVKSVIKPVYYASSLEALITLGIGVFCFIVVLFLWKKGRRHPDYEREWTDRRLQFTSMFSFIFIMFAFLRYEGIPYISMQIVFGIICLWALISLVQLVLYRQFVLKPARTAWTEHKAREEYLPKPRKK